MIRALKHWFAQPTASIPALVEGLESRQFLSATPVVAAAVHHVTSHVTMAKPTIPNVLGTYTGPANLITGTQQLTLQVTSQHAGTVTGTVAIAGQPGTVAFKGTVDVKGSVKLTLHITKTATAVVKGTVAKDGSISGTFITTEHGFSIPGTFSVTKSA